MNLYDFLLTNANPDAAVIQSRSEHTTYQQLITTARCVAATLTAAGVQPGDRVGIVARNSTFWVACYLAILKIGAVVVPFSEKFSLSNFRDRQALVGCRFFCMTPMCLRKFHDQIPGDSIIIIETHLPALSSSSHKILEISSQEDNSPAVTVSQDDLAALMFTSGSTGMPNAVKVTHRNIQANTESIIDYLGLASDDRMMVVMPFDYCFAASLLHTHLRVGGQLVLNNNFVFAEEVLNDIEAFACTGLAGVPAIFQHLLQRSPLAQHQLPSLRHVQQAGGKLHTRFIKAFVDALPHVRFFVMYGQTEATARLSYLPPEHLADRLGSIGKGIPGVTLRVVDGNDRDVSPGEQGEIVAEGNNIAPGYLIPDSENPTFQNGKLYTGDLATVDEEGFIFVVGRKKDFIKPFGQRISCAEIEGVLLELENIVEAAVIGIQDDQAGEIARAFVVVKPDTPKPDIEQLRQHCKQKLPYYGVPGEFVFVDNLPKNTAGKVIKRLLDHSS